MLCTWPAVGGSNLELADLSSLNLPLLILSAQQIVILTTQAFERLSACKVISGSPVQDPGISVIPDGDSCFANLSLLLNQLVHQKVYSKSISEDTGASVTPKPSGIEQDGGESTHGDQDTAIEDIWNDNLTLQVTVNIICHSPRRNTVRADLTARSSGSTSQTYYFLTFSRPATDTPSFGRTGKSQRSETVGLNRSQDRGHEGDIFTSPQQHAEEPQLLKDDILDNTTAPAYLITADETKYYPNTALRNLMSQHGDENTPDFWYQPCSRWELWDETFTRRLPVSEYPALKLIQARTSFAEKKYGFRDPENNTRVRLDLSGNCLYEKSSGAFLGGVVWRRDVSVYEHGTAQQNQEIEGGFKSWLDYMPSISWQASAEWNLQYFSG